MFLVMLDKLSAKVLKYVVGRISLTKKNRLKADFPYISPRWSGLFPKYESFHIQLFATDAACRLYGGHQYAQHSV